LGVRHDACIEAASQDGNAVVLNSSTDGVSVETKSNFNQILLYLDGESDMLALPDTNHNAKNLRYHVVGGNSPASIGKYVVDPWLFVQAADVPKYLARVDDYASDAVVLGLASTRVVKAVLELNSADVGNSLVSCFTISNAILSIPALL
jgi:hypothetical protein